MVYFFCTMQLILKLLFITSLQLLCESLVRYLIIGEGGWFIIFRLFKSILFFVNWILLFQILFNAMLCLLIFYFDYIVKSRRDFFSFRPALLLSILAPLYFLQTVRPALLLSILLSTDLLRLYVFFIVGVPMREFFGKHSCMSSQCPIALLNGTSFFCSLVQEKLHVPSGHSYGHCSWSLH